MSLLSIDIDDNVVEYDLTGDDYIDIYYQNQGYIDIPSRDKYHVNMINNPEIVTDIAIELALGNYESVDDMAYKVIYGNRHYLNTSLTIDVLIMLGYTLVVTDYCVYITDKQGVIHSLEDVLSHLTLM